MFFLGRRRPGKRTPNSLNGEVGDPSQRKTSAPTGAGVEGVGKDAVDAARGLAQGRVVDAGQAAARGAITGVGAYLGGQTGARVARFIANSKAGSAVTRVSSYVIVGVVAFSMVMSLLMGAGLFSILTIFGGAQAAAACVPGAGTAGAAPLENPTREQVAGTIYAQAVGLGLGEVAALVGIGVGYGETGLQNDTDGDCWRGSCANGRTSSRGVFQQFYSWPPPGTAWSGLPAPTGGVGTRFEAFNGTNAWGAYGWARTDPRMNVAQAANMFLLGPDYGASSGLEDNTLFQSISGRDPSTLSTSVLVTIAQQVQGFPAHHMGSYEANIRTGLQYFQRIKRGDIPTPPFVMPLAGIVKAATTPATREVVAGVTDQVVVAPSPQPSPSRPAGGAPSATGRPATLTSSEPDGLLLIGDSLMDGVVNQGGAPREIFGKPTATRTQIGIGTKAALDKWGNDLSTGPNRVIVSLGSNDWAGQPSTFDAQIARFMTTATASREVFWFSLHYKPAQQHNETLMRAAARYPNLTVININDKLTPNSGLLTPGMNYLHPNTDGYKTMWAAALNTLQGASASGGMVMSNAACVGFSFTGAGANPLAEAALTFATEQIGKPYGYPQGNPPATWDCSKFTGGSYNYAWEQAGKPAEYAYLGKYPFLPRSALSYDQYRHPQMTFVPLAEALPGDFIFFNGNLGMSAGNPIDHVALIYDTVEKTLIESGDPVNINSYMDNLARSGNGQGIAGPPKADGSPTLPGEPGWEPVVGRLIPLPVTGSALDAGTQPSNRTPAMVL